MSKSYDSRDIQMLKAEKDSYVTGVLYILENWPGHGDYPPFKAFEDMMDAGLEKTCVGAQWATHIEHITDEYAFDLMNMAVTKNVSTDLLIHFLGLGLYEIYPTFSKQELMKLVAGTHHEPAVAKLPDFETHGGDNPDDESFKKATDLLEPFSKYSADMPVMYDMLSPLITKFDGGRIYDWCYNCESHQYAEKRHNSVPLCYTCRDVDKSDIDKSDIDKSDIDKSDIDKSDVDKSDVDKSDVDKSDIDKSDVDKSVAVSS